MAKLRHVAVMVDDLDVAAEFWSSAFELEEIGRVGDPAVVGAVYLTDGVMNVSLIKAMPGSSQEFPKGLNHLGFVVEDADASMERAAAAGAVSILTEEERARGKAGGSSWEVKMRTPDGIAFDFSEHGWPGNTQLYPGTTPRP